MRFLPHGVFGALIALSLALVGYGASGLGADRLGGQYCADLVARQAASTDVVPGAWQCIDGRFKADMVSNDITDADHFAQDGPGDSPALKVTYVGKVGSAYIYDIGGAIWRFTVDGDGKVVWYK